jgi:hypothetical protein
MTISCPFYPDGIQWNLTFHQDYGGQSQAKIDSSTDADNLDCLAGATVTGFVNPSMPGDWSNAVAVIKCG